MDSKVPSSPLMSGDASTPSRLARGVFSFTIRHDAGGWYWGSPNRTGADKATKCYPRVIFGRELLRTGLGGFVTPRVVNFYHQYLAKVFAMVKGEGRVKMDERYKTQQNKKKAWNEELFFFSFWWKRCWKLHHRGIWWRAQNVSRHGNWFCAP